MNVPVGSQRICRFYFSLRDLTIAEDEFFFDPLRTTFPGLPAGVGFKPHAVIFEYDRPGAEQVTVEPEEIAEDAQGEYHVLLFIPLDGAGAWSYRARAEVNGKSVASTLPRSFTARGL